MSWFGFKPSKSLQEKEMETIQYKDLDNDETEHTIDNENIESFHDDQVDSNEQEEI